MSLAGLPTAVWIQLRAGWQAVAAWVVALGATMLATTSAIGSLYDTPAKIDSYARSVGSAAALEAINGHVYGISTLGGVIANEFGFIASFALPLMGIGLMARATRRDEETGRLEMLLAGRIGRSAPLVSAVLVTTAAVALTAAALAAGMIAAGVAVADSVAYAAALGALTLVFAGIAAVGAQLVAHARGVYALGLAALVLAYLLRGAGAVLDNALIWLSPLGWVQETRAFADTRAWPVLLALGVAVLLIILAVAINARRDLGSAPLHRGGGASGASAFLASRSGFAVRTHRGSVASWSVGAVIVAGTFGALAQGVIEAMAGNPALQAALGGTGRAGVTGFVSMAVLLLALLCGAYLIQAVATLRNEEAAGRVGPALSAPVRRRSWLGIHLGVILGGLVVVAVLGALALGLTTAWSTGDALELGRFLRAVASYVPALLVLGAVALVLFAALPRVFALAWLAFGFTAVVAFLGEALSLPAWMVDLAPLSHVGFPPQDPAGAAALASLAAVAAALCLAGFTGFARRGIR